MLCPKKLQTKTGIGLALSSILVAISAGTASAAPAAAPAIGGPALASRGVVVSAHAPRLPAGIDARGWLVADADTGQVLAAKDPHGRFLPASTLKTLTALTLLPTLTDRQQIVTATSEDTNVDGTRVGLVPNGRYSVELLFECMLMMSGNDCATALARTAGDGSVARSLAAMNTKAKSIDALDTHAGTPSGLDAPGQSSSAYDLALILRRDIAITDFRRYNSKLTGFIPAQGKKYKRFGFANDDRLRKSHYPGVIAAKNGYTDAARHEFVAAVRHGSHTLIVTLMHAERYPVDTQNQAIALFNWGFAVDGKIPPVGTLNAAQPRPVRSPSPSVSVAPSTQPANAAAASTGSGGSGGPNWKVPTLVGAVVIIAGAGGIALYRTRVAH